MHDHTLCKLKMCLLIPYLVFNGIEWMGHCWMYVCICMCIYVYIYICCEVIIWSKFGGFWKLLSGPSWVFGSYYLVQVGFLEVIIWSKFEFLAYKNSGFKRFVLHTQLSFCVFFLSPIIRQFSKNSLFQKKGAKIGFFKSQCFKFKFWKFSFFRLAKTL